MSEERSFSAFQEADAEETEIRALVERAGPRPVVAAEDLESVRRAAREQWRQLVRAEKERARFVRRRTALAVAASLLLAVALGWWLMPEPGGRAPQVVASVELVRGDVRLNGVPAPLGAEVSAGAVLEIGAEASGAALRLAGSQSVRFDAETRVRLTTESGFELERGAMYVDTRGAATGTAVEVATAFGSVRDVGTQFLVRVSARDAARIRVLVREGEVVFERPSDSYSAVAGAELILPLDSDEVETDAIESHGGAWDWVEGLAPAMDIEGARLSDYLEWVSRETGRELRYGDESLAASARTITLSGSITGLTPEESLSILPGSGLDHRIENGWLLIERPER